MTPLLRRVHAMTGRKMALICRVLGISRACAYRESQGRPARYARADDRVVTAQIRTVIRTRASYGARRVRAHVNPEFATGYNLKRIQRVMALQGWTLPRVTRRRTGRAHRGQIHRPASNERWCSDVLEIACWSGEIAQVGCALDCHDREALAHVAVARDFCAAEVQQLTRAVVAARFGAGARPDAPLQWLGDNGSIHTAMDSLITAERLHLVPITTPTAGPQSNGMSEAFVNTMRRDYIAGADLATAAAVLPQIPAWFADYNAVAPYSALGYQSLLQYRRAQADGTFTW
jgi:putative transposase